MAWVSSPNGWSTSPTAIRRGSASSRTTRSTSLMKAAARRSTSSAGFDGSRRRCDQRARYQNPSAQIKATENGNPAKAHCRIQQRRPASGATVRNSLRRSLRHLRHPLRMSLDQRRMDRTEQPNNPGDGSWVAGKRPSSIITHFNPPTAEFGNVLTGSSGPSALVANHRNRGEFAPRLITNDPSRVRFGQRVF